ncbi:MAG: dTDP-4-dehydrorhamnose reductase [Candidatus Muproteobacteria bacterium RBG_16_62_13]|uniref:dTDP-4-dehydrorhamnose reductase n=1 Tax=Candidatus Muproteobacteria bacterium RBG_16_62_13 TaxID=1817756 RepID=A0A1F6T5J0_9PROT|nr:MAG: dTDP-4-dehydrorhamnose reductase [Candidatus Muproteobacteria bacterium RBG_16_62_13]
MQTILLTGASGQVGWELQRVLAPLGRVVAVDLKQMNLAEPDSIRRVLRNVSPNLIVNTAAYTAVDKAETEPDLAMAVNGTAPAVLAEEARRLKAGLVHYSTDYVFDGTKTGAYTEEDQPNPLGVYGRTKLAGEAAVLASGVPHLVLRTSWIYGARGHNFFLTMRRLGAERPELRVVDDQIGAPTWCRALAEVTGQMLAICGPSGMADRSGLYHVTNAGETSWCGFARRTLELSGLKTPVSAIRSSDYPTPARRPANSRLMNGKLQRVFGLSLPPWEESLALCLDELSARSA